MIIGNTTTNLLATEIAGRKEIAEGLFLVAGGHIGVKYDVIVDSISEPSKIIGVCGDPGRVMNERDAKANSKLSAVEDFLSKTKVV